MDYKQTTYSLNPTQLFIHHHHSQKYQRSTTIPTKYSVSKPRVKNFRNDGQKFDLIDKIQNSLSDKVWMCLMNVSYLVNEFEIRNFYGQWDIKIEIILQTKKGIYSMRLKKQDALKLINYQASKLKGRKIYIKWDLKNLNEQRTQQKRKIRNQRIQTREKKNNNSNNFFNNNYTSQTQSYQHQDVDNLHINQYYNNPKNQQQHINNYQNNNIQNISSTYRTNKTLNTSKSYKPKKYKQKQNQDCVLEMNVNKQTSNGQALKIVQIGQLSIIQRNGCQQSKRKEQCQQKKDITQQQQQQNEIKILLEETMIKISDEIKLNSSFNVSDLYQIFQKKQDQNSHQQPQIKNTIQSKSVQNQQFKVVDKQSETQITTKANIDLSIMHQKPVDITSKSKQQKPQIQISAEIKQSNNFENINKEIQQVVQRKKQIVGSGDKKTNKKNSKVTAYDLLFEFI